MKRTLYLAFLALTLSSLAIAQDGRGQNKKDQKPPAPKQEQRQSPPPPKREERQPERSAPPAPKREETGRGQQRNDPPPQKREERNTPPAPKRDDSGRGQARTDPPPQRREEKTSPPPQKREDKQPERNAPPAPRRNDNGRGQQRNDPPQDRRDNNPPQRRDDNNRSQNPPRNTPPEQNRGGNRLPTDRAGRPEQPRGGTNDSNRGGSNELSRGGRESHNQVPTRGQRVSFNPPPVVINSKTTTRAWREDRTVRNVPYRSGYYHYNDTWCDRDFFYSHYVYSINDRCAPSPWYWYPHLPAYVAWDRCRPTLSVIFSFGYGDRYDYRPYYYNNFAEDRLDCAADRLEDSFRRRDFSLMSYLVDRNDWVQIQVENADYYDLRGDDFADMVRDLVEGTHTISYKITDVHSWRDGASITARHTYVDSWGHRESVDHQYGLRRTSRGYEIISFRTDHL